MEEKLMWLIMGIVLLLSAGIGMVLPLNTDMHQDMYQIQLSNTSTTYLRHGNVINATVVLVNSSLNSSGGTDRMISGTDYNLLPMPGNDTLNKIWCKSTSNNCSTACIAQPCNVTYDYITNANKYNQGTTRSISYVLYTVLFLFCVLLIWRAMKND
jgi:hypothetical protein